MPQPILCLRAAMGYVVHALACLCANVCVRRAQTHSSILSTVPIQLLATSHPRLAVGYHLHVVHTTLVLLAARTYSVGGSWRHL